MPVHNIFTVLNKLTFLFLYGNCNYNYIIKHGHSKYTQRHEIKHNDQLIGIKNGKKLIYIKLTTPYKQLST